MYIFKVCGFCMCLFFFKKGVCGLLRKFAIQEKKQRKKKHKEKKNGKNLFQTYHICIEICLLMLSVFFLCCLCILFVVEFVFFLFFIFFWLKHVTFLLHCQHRFCFACTGLSFFGSSGFDSLLLVLSLLLSVNYVFCFVFHGVFYGMFVIFVTAVIFL